MAAIYKHWIDLFNQINGLKSNCGELQIQVKLSVEIEVKNPPLSLGGGKLFTRRKIVQTDAIYEIETKTLQPCRSNDNIGEWMS